MALTKVQGEGISGLSISANNEITMSSQPAFHATKSGNQNNVADNTTIAFDVERFDNNLDFDGTSTFTAPVTGRYMLGIEIRVDGLENAHSYFRPYIVTSNKNYTGFITAGNALANDPTYYHISASILADLDAGDTAYVTWRWANGSAQDDISADSIFYGYLVC